MTTTTDYLLADLIAHLSRPLRDTSDAARVKYAADRLALAEQKSAPVEPPQHDAPASLVKIKDACEDSNSDLWIAFRRYRQRGYGAEGVHAATRAIIDAAYNAGLNAKEQVEPPRADWIDEARKRAHAALEGLNPVHSAGSTPAALTISPPAPTFDEARGMAFSAFYGAWNGTSSAPNNAISAALDAFIAAMPPQHGHDAEFEQFQIALTHAYEGVTGEQVQWSNNFGPRDAAESILAVVQAPEPQPEEYDDEMPPQSADPQPEEVLEEMYRVLRAGLHARGWGVECETDLRDALQAAWNASRRYAPMPARVTEENITAARNAVNQAGFYAPRKMLMLALEAALAAAPKEGE